MRRALATRRALLRIDGRPVEVTVRLNPRARRLIVKVHPSTGEVTVTAPSQRSLERALRFAQGESRWIARQLSRVPQRVDFAPGAKVPFLGHEHVIEHVERGTVRDADARVIRIGGQREFVARRLTDFLKREAKRELETRSHAFAARIDAKVRRVSVRDTASRWGSCSTKGSISYCWRLVMAPEFVLDYVVAHEVAHLREMNHGPRFWKLVRSIVPDVRMPRNWLHTHGNLLHRYGAR
ncbi:MAG: M48 family metallopeptidase [Alphaproteobacteria bacterium]|nr:M48 family metallopeptidase [Alphaproteobacteria bacterium]